MDRWTCPNDRQLALRAKLGTGWSVHTNRLGMFHKGDNLSIDEQEHIMNVICKADFLERNEQERIGRLVEKLDNMKKNAIGNGTTQCILCGDEFGLLGASPTFCDDCKNAVCTKCGIDTYNCHKQPLWLCKICSENREVWKRSGAWFFKGLPKYTIPEKKAMEAAKVPTSKGRSESRGVQRGTQGATRNYNTWSRGRGNHAYGESSEQDTESSSEDEISIGKRKIGRNRGDSESDNISVTSSASGQYYSGHNPKEMRGSVTSSNYHGSQLSATESSRGDDLHEDTDSESVGGGHVSASRHHSSAIQPSRDSRYRYH